MYYSYFLRFAGALSACLFILSNGFAQGHENLDYECLETPLVFTEPSYTNIHWNCVGGQLLIDTLAEDCFGFYEEDGHSLKTWYYVAPGEVNPVDFFFEELRLREDADLTGNTMKYFECQRTGIWYSFIGSPVPVQRLSVPVKDISGQGVNFGMELGVGPVYYPSFEDLANEAFEEVSVDYTDGILTIEGDIPRLYIGGEHLYIGNLLLNQTVTSVASVNILDWRLYPNPTTGEIRLTGDNLSGSMLQIVSSAGSIIARTEITTNDWYHDLSMLPRGTYWVVVRQDQQTLFSKMVTKQ